METGYVVLMVLFALVIGVVMGRFIWRAKKDTNGVQGILYVNPSSPEGQGLFLEQSVLTSEISTRDRVVFEVVVLRDTRK